MTELGVRVAARLELLLELEAIGEGLVAIEQRLGLHPDIEAAWQRQQRTRGRVLEQLRVLLARADVATVQ